MWPGPFGDGGSRKYLVSSCDQSLKRTGLDYFDVFYHHRFDTETPIEESMQALDYIVRSGRALYVGISNYGPEQTLHAIKVLKDLGTPLLVHQPKYNMFDRSIEDGLTDVLQSHGIGSIVFSPLAQGLLSDKYISGIPADSRAARKEAIYLNASDIKSSTIEKIHQLNELALEREQSLAQMAIAWTLNNQAVTSCLIGASKVEQIVDSCNALKNLEFSKAEMDKLNKILAT